MVMGIIDSAPDVDIESIVPMGYATTIYDSEGNLTDTLVTEGSNREEVTFDELPQDLIDAFVAIEDSRFWSHNGVDIRSIARAAMGVITGDNKGGGSTLTQQLIKNNVFGGGMEKSFGARLERKLQEQYLAIQLTKSMDRKLILTNYLNTINLGNNTLGVKVAARRYFNKEVSDLTLSECAVIAGITQNPSYYNPISGKEHNEEKRKVILQYMHDQELITKEEQEEALADDVYARIQNNDLVAKESSTAYSYFTDELINQVKTTLVEHLGYTETQAYNLIYKGGLQIHTTQDPRIQAIVDEEVNRPENYSAARYSIEYRLSVTHSDDTTTHYSEENIKNWHRQVLMDSHDGLYNSEEEAKADIDAYKSYLLKEGDNIIGERLTTTLQPQVSFVIMDQATGQVKALSGGRGAKTASLTLNRATDSPRQPGSTFKVITAFAPALDTKKATLGTVYYDSVYTNIKTFSNWYSQGYMGYSNIRDGIIYSMNIVAVRCLMETVSPQTGMDYAKNFGITTMTSSDLTPASALGGLTIGVSNLEMTAAYATIANEGIYTEPVFFTRILDRNGKVLYENTPSTHQVLYDSTAYLLTSAMADSLKNKPNFATSGSTINATSRSAALNHMSVAGKSGTTTSNNDIWFVGYTPYYTAGIWAGCDNNQKLTAQNGGTSFHKAIWKKIMDRVHEDMSDPGFTVPDSVETVSICRKSGKLPVPGVCDHDPRGSAVYTEYFAKGTAPKDLCNTHVSVSVCSESGLRSTEFCPSKTSRICLTLPSGETGSTDDSRYAIPDFCNIHTSTGSIITPETDDVEIGPGVSPAKPGISPGQDPSGGSPGSSPDSNSPGNSGSNPQRPTSPVVIPIR